MVAVDGVNFYLERKWKDFHLSALKDLEVLSLGFRSLFIVEKRALVLMDPECMRCEK